MHALAKSGMRHGWDRVSTRFVGPPAPTERAWPPIRLGRCQELARLLRSLCMSVPAPTVIAMDEIDVGFSFYDDPDYVGDADRDSRKLRRWHQLLWSKPLPNGARLEWSLDPGTSCLFSGDQRVSSDTIATTHANYRRAGTATLYEGLTETERESYERAFYTIGGFIIFPTRPQSLNQRRGTSTAIADRFDLTLECIRRHYAGDDNNPLSDVLAKAWRTSDFSVPALRASTTSSSSSTFKISQQAIPCNGSTDIGAYGSSTERRFLKRPTATATISTTS